MAAAWESVGVTPSTATSDLSVAVPKPTGLTAGDLMVAFGGCVNGRTVSPPSGSWTTVANDTDGVNRVYVFTKVADSGDVAASTFTFSTNGGFASLIAAVHRVSGASSNTPTCQFGTGANSQTQQCPSVTTPAADCLVFWGCYAGANTTSTADKGTERVDSGNATASCWTGQYTNPEPSAGPVTGATITTGAFGAKRVFSVAVESAGGGGGTTVTPTTLALALATFAPTVAVSGSQTVTPPTAALTLATFAPTVTATASGGSHPFRSALIQGMY